MKKIVFCLMIGSFSLANWGCEPAAELAVLAPVTGNRNLHDIHKIAQTTYWKSLANSSPTNKTITFEGTNYNLIPYRISTYTYDTAGRIQTRYDSTWSNNSATSVAVWQADYKYEGHEMIVNTKSGAIYRQPLDANGYVINDTKNEFDKYGNLSKDIRYNDNWIYNTTYAYDLSRTNLPATETYNQSSKNLLMNYDFTATSSASSKQHVIGKYAYTYDNIDRITSQVEWTKTLENSTIFMHTDGITLIEFQYR